MASKVSALESPRVLTLPDVRVALWIKLEIEPALLSSRTAGNHGLSRQFAFTTTALSGFFWRKNSSMASFFRRGFQLAHSSDPSFRMVGRNNDRLRALSVCASSTHATSNPSRPSASLKKGERRGVTCRYDSVKRGQNRADEITQEIGIDFRSPVMARTWSIAEPGPVSRDRLIVRTESLLKWAHFTPGRNRAERGQQQN